MSGIHTCLPGRIEKYDATKKKASIQPLIKIKFKKQTEYTSMPIINNVPVQFPCTRKSLIHFPLERGDGCLLLFSERSLEKYLNTVITKESEPQDPRKFALSDAIAIPGLFSFSDTGKIASDTSAMEIMYDDGYVNIQGNSNFAVLYNELKAKLDALETQLKTHVHPGVSSGGSSTGASATAFDCDISSAKSAKVKLGG